MTTPPPPSPPLPRAQSAGRGLLLITIAKLWFMVGGGALGLLLPRMFPRDQSAARFGDWGAVLACMSVLNNVVITGTIQGVARFAARGPEWIEGTKRLALRSNAVAVSLLALGYFLAAPHLAAFVKNPGLVGPLRLSTGVVLCYGLYPVFVGAANGAREFHKQAGLDIAFTTLRAGLVLLAAALLSTVTAAVGGFVAAAALILAVSVGVVGWGQVARRPTAAEWLGFVGPVAAYLAVQNLLLFVDLWLVERYVALAAEAAGTSASAATAVASRAVGAYNAALQIARLPYQATIAVTLVVFPLVSQASFASDGVRMRLYVGQAMRLSLLVVLGAAAAGAARPDSLFLLLFPRTAAGVNEYLVGAAALGPLLFAYAAFSLLSIASTILNGAGAARAALLIGLGTLGVDVGLNAFAIRQALAAGHSALPAAGLATLAAMSAGLLAALLYLQAQFGASLAPPTAARALLAAAVAVVAGRALPLPGRAGLLGAALAALVYAAVLAATREVTLAEARRLLRRS